MAHEGTARRLAILSGKGGVGKSVIAANLGAILSEAGRRVLVVDADLGLANLDVILGIHPQVTLRQVLDGVCPIDRAIWPTQARFDLLPGGSGSFDMTALTAETCRRIESWLAQVGGRYDDMLLDLGAGIGEEVLHFAALADEVLLVVTPEPTSVTDAYATIKVLARRYGRRQVSVVVNRAGGREAGHTAAAVVRHLQHVVDRFLSDGAPVTLTLRAAIPEDAAVGDSVRRQCLLALLSPGAPACQAIAGLGRALVPVH